MASLSLCQWEKIYDTTCADRLLLISPENLLRCAGEANSLIILRPKCREYQLQEPVHWQKLTDRWDSFEAASVDNPFPGRQPSRTGRRRRTAEAPEWTTPRSWHRTTTADSNINIVRISSENSCRNDETCRSQARKTFGKQRLSVTYFTTPRSWNGLSANGTETLRYRIFSAQT